MFYYIVEKANLKIEDLKAPQQKACIFDQKPIILDGQMSMKVSLGDRTVTTTVFVKLMAPHQLLLSESVCRQLEIVSYRCVHPSVQTVETEKRSTAEFPTTEEGSTEEGPKPAASVKLISVVRLPAHHSTATPVKVEDLC